MVGRADDRFRPSALFAIFAEIHFIMKKIIGILVPFVLLLISCSGGDVAPCIVELEQVLERKSTYQGYFNDRVEILKAVLSDQIDPQQTYNINKRLADAYKAHSFDSTMAYLNANKALGLKMRDMDKVMETDFLMVLEYCIAGYYVEAGDLLTQYDREKIPYSLERDFVRACQRFYGETSAYASSEDSYDDKKVLRDAYRARLIELTPEGTPEWYDLKREEAADAEDPRKALEYARMMVEATEENSHDYAKACYMYASSLPENDVHNRMEWLARSAIADIMCSVKDYMSLNSLSELLFENGDVERAFRYAADHCMTDALQFGGRLRQWQISQFFPQIEREYNERNLKNIRVMVMLVVIISLFLAIVILMMLLIIKRQRTLVATQKELKASYKQIDDRNHELEAINSKLSALNAQIQEADKVKQEYIALFLSILSENISTTRQYKNHVLKNIRQGSTKKLVDEIEALPPIDEDIYEFYKMFDQTFVNLYPDFVPKFNELLSEGSAIVPKGDDILSPELRIFALIKLGITDSSKIASLLHYSANTIYNYRAKTKNKARGSRDEFEDAVRNID